MTKDELLVKIATVLRLPIHEIIHGDGKGGAWAYNKSMIEELLDNIKASMEQRDKPEKP